MLPWLGRYFSAVVRHLSVNFPMRGILEFVGDSVDVSDEMLEDGTKVTRVSIDSSDGSLPAEPRNEGYILQIENGDPEWVPDGSKNPDAIAWDGAWGPEAAYDGTSWEGIETPFGETGTPSGAHTATPTASPGTTTINGLSAPTFNGSSQFFTADCTLDELIDPDTGICSGVIVFRATTRDTYLYDGLVGTGAAEKWALTYGPGGFSFVFYAQGNVPRRASAGANDGQTIVAMFRYDGAHIEVSTDFGATWYATAAVWDESVVAPSTRSVYFGKNNTFLYEGAIAEWKIKKFALSREVLVAYATRLGAKYGLTPPSIHVEPFTPEDREKLDGLQQQGSTATPSTVGSTHTIDWSQASTHVQTLAAGANTIDFVNVVDGKCIIVKLIGDGSGSTVNWPAGVEWGGGIAPTQTSAGKAVYTLVAIDEGAGVVVTGSALLDVQAP